MGYGGEVLAQKNARKIVIFLNNKNEKNPIKMLQILSNYGNINNIGEPKKQKGKNENYNNNRRTG